MKLLLRRDISKVGLAGDVVDVSEGYARNYLIPQQLGVEPTKANMKRIEEDKRLAEEERKQKRVALEARATRLRDVEVTIAAACNPEGHLYGSVGPREIAAALRDEGHDVETKQVKLHEPLRQLDTITVPVSFADDLQVDVKVWIVRESGSGLEEIEKEERGAEADRKEARQDDPGTGIDALDFDL
jgi:large subunit ribosomal protein L9